jgi:hypothetical protein
MIKKWQLFPISPAEHPLDAIARRVGILIHVRKMPEEYNFILEGGDLNETWTELHNIKLQDKSIFWLHH